jgi:hypothetical protein
LEDGNVRELWDSNAILGIEELSIQMLKTLFDVHEMARNEVITTATNGFYYYENTLLEKIVKRN